MNLSPVDSDYWPSWPTTAYGSHIQLSRLSRVSNKGCSQVPNPAAFLSKTGDSRSGTWDFVHAKHVQLSCGILLAVEKQRTAK